MPRLTEPELRAAMEKTPPELHRLLVWLVTGNIPPSGSARNGTT
jgi:hypothetical protein